MKNIKTIVKVRGLCITSATDTLITFENLKRMVLEDAPPRTIPIPHQITRLPGWKIVTRDTSKKWQVCLNKRRRIDKERTVPYGYKKSELNEEDLELLEILQELVDA